MVTNNIVANSRSWGWWLTLGIMLVILGLVLLSTPVVATFATVLTIGVLLIIASIIHIITAFLEKKSEYFWLHLVIAAFTGIVGILMLTNPAVTTMALTLLIAAFFLCVGIFRIVGALTARFKGWGWFVVNGLISVALGLLILFHWPSSSLWVIGLFMGIDFLFAGLSLIMVALDKKKGVLEI